MTYSDNYLKKIIPNTKPDLVCQFEKFYLLITHYNSVINLFSKKTSAWKHLADSYLGMEMILKLLDPTPNDLLSNHYCGQRSRGESYRFYDFGSGNGFPGLVGALMEPGNRFILVEKNRKKAQFLKMAVNELDLKNVEIFNGQISSLNTACVQFGISRAMSPLPRLLAETQKVTERNGKIFLFKGQDWTGEVKACSSEILKSWKIKEAGSYIIEDQRLFIIVCLRTRAD